MLPDYYQVLGLPPTATAAEIRQAYRRLAAQRHPDQGGSHTAFLELSEAYLVLSDPAARQRYDEARQNQTRPELQEAVAADRAQAYHRAQQYPRDSSDLDQWLDALARDFQNARYGTTKGPISLPWPTIANSVSGTSFLVVGGLVGLLCFGLYVATVFNNPHAQRKPSLTLMVIYLLVLVTIGAWVGYVLHRILHAVVDISTRLGRAFHNQSSDRPSTAASATADGGKAQCIVTCISCRQSLRLPLTDRELLVTCPKCKSKFTCRAGKICV